MLQSVEDSASMNLSGRFQCNRWPRSPRGGQFVVAGGIAAGALFWRARKRRAAAAAFTSVAIEAVNILATDFSGEPRKLLRLLDHARLGLRNAPTIELYPVLLETQSKAAGWFFPCTLRVRSR